MKGAFDGLVRRYGRPVVCRDGDGKVTAEGMAFFQAVTEKEWQKSAGALGAFRTDRFLCLAPAELDLGQPGDGGWLECGGVCYRLMAVHPVCLGQVQTHWWAVLEVKDEDAA